MSPDVYEAVNEINRQIPMAKVTVDEENAQVVMTIELPVINTLTPDDLMLALEIVSTEADHFDTLLQKRFGGTTALEDEGLDPACWTRLIPDFSRGKRDDPTRWQESITPRSSAGMQSSCIA